MCFHIDFGRGWGGGGGGRERERERGWQVLTYMALTQASKYTARHLERRLR